MKENRILKYIIISLFQFPIFQLFSKAHANHSSCNKWLLFLECEIKLFLAESVHEITTRLNTEQWKVDGILIYVYLSLTSEYSLWSLHHSPLTSEKKDNDWLFTKPTTPPTDQSMNHALTTESWWYSMSLLILHPKSPMPIESTIEFWFLKYLIGEFGVSKRGISMCKVSFFFVIQYHPSETNLKIYILGKFRLMIT